MTFELTQGTFSFLPPLSDDEVSIQIQDCLDNHRFISVEFTDDPHSRTTCWEKWEPPILGMQDAATILHEINACRRTYPHHYIRVCANNCTQSHQPIVLSFIVNRPTHDPGCGLVHREVHDRLIRYTLHHHVMDKPREEHFS